MAANTTFVWTLLAPRARLEHVIIFAANETEARARAIQLSETDDDKHRASRWLSFLKGGATPDAFPEGKGFFLE